MYCIVFLSSFGLSLGRGRNFLDIMKIAYIITGYTDPEQLRRLIDALQLSPELGTADFYLHIDKKVAITPFTEAMDGCHAEVFWCKKRYWINWGGFNQVWSQYELLRMIFEETKRKYDRLICLSATDYPLWANKRIVAEFASHADKEFVGGYNLSTSLDNTQRSKVCIYHFFRDVRLPLMLKRAVCFTSRTVMRKLPLKKPTSFIGSLGQKYDVYTGSDYWGVTYNCAQFVFETMRDDKKLMNYFKHSYIPSESVVNTIVFNSKYKNQCTIHIEQDYYPGLEALTPLHHTYYKGAIKVYQLKDWEELMSTDRMFFRKAKSGISDTLIERLEKEVRSK